MIDAFYHPYLVLYILHSICQCIETKYIYNIDKICAILVEDQEIVVQHKGENDIKAK